MRRHLFVILSLSVFVLIESHVTFSQIDGSQKARLLQKLSNFPIFITAYPSNQFGTGIIFSAFANGISEYTIVTCKHIFDRADSIHVLLQIIGEDDRPMDTITKSYRLYTKSKDSLFVVHDSLDLGALYVNYINQPAGQGGSIYTIKDYNLVDPDSLFQGQEVVFFGYPEGIKMDGYRPLARKGIIAGYERAPGYKGLKSVIYLDGQVYGGSSGSPVFINPIVTPLEEMGWPKIFVGIIAQYILTEDYRIIALHEKDVFSFKENTGIGIIMAAEDISLLANKAKNRYQQYRLK
jgi:hypothetical protein